MSFINVFKNTGLFQSSDFLTTIGVFAARVRLALNYA